MNRRLVAMALALGLFGSVVGPVRAEKITPEQVRQAIDRGTNFLLDQQHKDGSWPEMVAQNGGISSLCTLALLNSGVDVKDQRMQKALSYLRKIKPEHTYVVALQTMVFARAEPDRDRILIDRNVRWLQETQIVAGPDAGSWSYPSFGGAGSGDNSNSQFALLALYEAERAGVETDDRRWRLAKKYWESCQIKNEGSWGYTRHSGKGTGSMTCAGITSLAIAADQVQSSGARVVGEQIECCAPRELADADRAIDRAVAWLGKNYSVTRNPPNNPWHLYYLYGFERVGRLTARRFIPLPKRPEQPEGADWYREGAEHLVRIQDQISGYWTGAAGTEKDPLVGTSFALLFLSKGRWPVLLAKLQYADGDDWNRHRSDAANLTRYVEGRWKRDLTWQVVDPRLATVEDLLQTPVLYLCGSQSPLPTGENARKNLAKKLRDYLDRGGFLMAEADCCGGDFDAGFHSLVKLMFPEPEYKLKLLEAEHPIWHAEEKVDPKQVRPIFGIEFGCRTSVIYVPANPPQSPRPSLSCLWELSRPGRGVKYHTTVQKQIKAAMSIGVNILAYATNRELKGKEDFFRPAIDRRPGDQVERGKLYVATLRHAGGCNAAPRAIANLMETAGRELKIRTHVDEKLLDIADDALFDYHLVFMHGRTAFHLTETEQKRLRQYVERGGMLMADSICASRAFTESFRRELSAVFSDRKLERISPDDPLFSPTYGGFDLRLVSRRDPETASKPGEPLKADIKKVPPDIEGIKFGDRWGVVFSQYDLSCALEKHDSLECRGYTKEDAARIGLNVVLYSLQQ